MGTPSDTRQQVLAQYWEASRRVRERFARFELENVLRWAQTDVITRMPDEELEDFLFVLRERVGAVEPAWAGSALVTGLGASARHLSAREELDEAFSSVRVIAQAVAAGNDVQAPSMELLVSVAGRDHDRDGRPRWLMLGRLADAIVWMTVKLFSEVPRSLIRTCSLAGCERVYVAEKNQRYCPEHQAEARRRTQRRAEQAFRQRRTENKRRKKR